MSLFSLSSDITIGSFHFSGVHDVVIRKSIHSYADTAIIRIPTICRVKSANSISDYQTTAHLINDRDPVVINLGYNGQMQEEFRGFVKRRSLTLPLEVECEGYVQPLRLDIDVTGTYDDIQASDLLNLLTANLSGNSTGISIQVANDIHITQAILDHNNGVQICDFIRRCSEGALNLFFINPTTLWCGYTYTPYNQNTDPFGLGQISYRLGYNCPAENSLKARIPYELVQIVFRNILPTGVTQQVLSNAGLTSRRRKAVAISNRIGSIADMQSIANEKEFKMNYSGYTGSIDAFLQPYCAPGWQANITDDQFPERNGIYLVESTEVTFGIHGARRKVELGPKMGFTN